MSANLRKFGTIISGNRQPNQEINPETRAAIIAAVIAGAKRSAVARDFGVSPSAVTRIFQRFEKTGNLQSQPRSGRPKSLSPRDKRAIIRQVRIKYDLTRRELVNDLQLSVSPSTVRRTLDEENLRKWRSKKRVHLSDESAKERLSFTHIWQGKEDELAQVCGMEDGVLVYDTNCDPRSSFPMSVLSKIRA